MNIVILGASGFIGNACYDHFSKQHQVIGIDITDRYRKGLIIEKDPAQVKTLLKEQHIDLVLNCAGSANIKESFTNPKADFLANTTYVETVLALLKEQSPRTRFISISSAAVYGNPERLPVSEKDKTHPLSPYGTHKLMSEELLADYSRLFNIPTLSVRIFSAYGVGLHQQFFHDLYHKFKSNADGVNLYGTGKESRDFIYITDITEALSVLMERADFKGEVYNLASGTESFIRPTAELFAGILNYKGRIDFSNEQLEGYPLNWQADISRLKGLGFTPKTELKQGLQQYADWLTSISKK